MSTLRDVQRMRTVTLIFDLGSISAAADVLGYTQSAVSQQLATLEREVGTTLVDRSRRPLRPTAAGALLRPHFHAVITAMGAADAAVDGLRTATDRVRLAAFPSALSAFVPAAVRDLRRAHRQAVVTVLQLETLEAVEHLLAGRADLAVVHHMPGAAVPDTAGLQRRRLLVDDLHVVLPDGHRLARHASVSVTDLEDEPLVLPRRDTPAGRFRALVEHLCAQAGFAPRVAFELDDLPAAQAFVAAGIGVVPMHGLTLATLPRGVTVRALEGGGEGSRSIEALAPATVSTGLVGELLDRLSEAARAYAARRGPARRGATAR